ncbi:MAG TPA: hypothetical protein VF132_11915, partial [Rudaea sp.]
MNATFVSALRMPERVLIRLQPDATLAWIGLDAGGRPLSGANAGAPPPETLARTQKIVAIVPA